MNKVIDMLGENYQFQVDETWKLFEIVIKDVEDGKLLDVKSIAKSSPGIMCPEKLRWYEKCECFQLRSCECGFSEWFQEGIVNLH